MSKRKILYVITMAELGGAQRYVYDLTMAGAKKDFEVFVAAGENGGQMLLEKLKENGIQTLKLKNLVRPISPLKDIKAVFELKNIYQKIAPDIIHLNSTKAGIIGSLASIIFRHKRAIRPKLIYTAHGWVFNEPMSKFKSRIFFILEKLTAKIKDRIICVSEFDRQVAIKGKIAPAEKLVAIHNGIDVDAMVFLEKNEAKKRLFENSRENLDLNRPVIGTLANFYPTKGLPYFVKAINILVNEKKKNIIGIVMGEGELRPELEKLIKQYDLENHFFLPGQIKNGAKYLKAFDLYVCSSVKEGFPYSILEAMAADLSIVSTGVGGIAEIITDNKNGLIAESKNAADSADKIEKMLNNQSDRERLSQKAKSDLINLFSQNKMIEETYIIYI